MLLLFRQFFTLVFTFPLILSYRLHCIQDTLTSCARAWHSGRFVQPLNRVRARAKVSRKGIGERALRARILVYNVYQNVWAKICQIGNNVRRAIAALNRNFKPCMQDTFARATHSAYAAARPSARATIGYLVYNFKPRYLDVDIFSTKRFNPLRNVLY